jgi:dolichyl-phosphate beta-glucosyltransferase
MTQHSPYLSLVIPAYNEEARLPATLEKVARFVISRPYSIEVIVVDNNSCDRTCEVTLAYREQIKSLTLIQQTIQGKGAAVRKGLATARGEYVFIADADLSMPIGEIDKFLLPEVGDYDIAIGSREAVGARRYGEPQYRHMMGRVFNFFVGILAVPGFSDTQCGFKCFRREAAQDLIRLQMIDGFAFDVELLFIARRRNYRIVEIPINWYYDSQSSVNPLRHTVTMFLELLWIRMNARQGFYNDKFENKFAVSNS